MQDKTRERGRFTGRWAQLFVFSNLLNLAPLIHLCTVILISCLVASQLTACGLAFGRKNFKEALAEGKIKRGLTMKEVYDLVGNPDSSTTSLINGRMVDIWYYLQTSRADEARYEEFFVETLGVGGYSPVGATESHLIVFSSGRVIAFDQVVPPKGYSSSRQEERPQPIETSGTGWVVANGYILTNYHNVEHMTTFVIHINGQAYPATVRLGDKEDGVALLKVNSDLLGQKGLPLGNSMNVKTGDKVWTLGFPLSGKLSDKPVMTEGTVTGLVGPGNDLRFFQLSMPIQPGNSGEPLFNERGEVIGIHLLPLDMAKVITARIPQASNANVALKINYAKDLLSTISDLPRSSPPQRSSDRPPVLDLLKKSEPLVVHIQGTRN